MNFNMRTFSNNFVFDDYSLSPCRFIDLLMSVVTAILTLVLSIVVHAGLDATCHAVNQGLSG